MDYRLGIRLYWLGFTCTLAGTNPVIPTPKGESAGEAFFIGHMK